MTTTAATQASPLPCQACGGGTWTLYRCVCRVTVCEACWKSVHIEHGRNRISDVSADIVREERTHV